MSVTVQRNWGKTAAAQPAYEAMPPPNQPSDIIQLEDLDEPSDDEYETSEEISPPTQIQAAAEVQRAKAPRKSKLIQPEGFSLGSSNVMWGILGVGSMLFLPKILSNVFNSDSSMQKISSSAWI